jgi:hypothetical protein
MTTVAKPRPVEEPGAPPNSMKILFTLVIVAAVANLPLAMANVALPSIMQQPDLQVEKPESETEIHL